MRLLRPLALCLALATPALSGTPGPTSEDPRGGAIVETGTDARLTPRALARRLATADIAVLGEVHDNPVHHRRQAWLVERLDPAGVAFEMVPEAAEPTLSALRAEVPDAGRRLERLPEALDWDDSGWPDFALYRPVFAAAGDARLTGGGVARPALETAMREGAAAAVPELAEAAGLSEPLPPELQARLEADMIAAHCEALPAAMAPGMVEAQRLRDARLAAAALRARSGGGPAVLIAGNGHARTDYGVPAVLARLAPGLDVLSLGQVEVADGAVPDPADGDPPYDFVWYSEPAGREDPCAAFADRPEE